MQWTGIAIILGDIFSLAAYNMLNIINAIDTLSMAQVLSVATGAFVAL